jgi:AbrB family looped-hinge helix DNA binding protein
MLINMRTATITGKGQISIPKELRELKGFNTGSKIAIMGFSDRIELRPLEYVSESMETAIASERVIDREWNNPKEDKTWKHL